MSARRFVGELERVDSPPPAEVEGPPVLATFLIASSVPATEYATRVRAVVSAAIRSANKIDAGSSENLPENLVPEWFAEVTRGSLVIGRDGAASFGARQYVQDRGEDPWDLQELLFCFDRQLRGWAWWDVTVLPGDSVVLWVDSSGEPVFPCEELRWLAYSSGAKTVEGPALRTISEWREQRRGSAM